jgi:hypothetical protein
MILEIEEGRREKKEERRGVLRWGLNPTQNW